MKVVFSEEEILKITPLIEFGLTNQEPIHFQGHSIIPPQFLNRILTAREQEEDEQGTEISGMVIWAAGKKNGESCKMGIQYLVEQEKCWGNIKTGVPFAVGTLMIGRGAISKRGFTVPEECINPVHFIQELKNRGCFRFTETEEFIRSI